MQIFTNRHWSDPKDAGSREAAHQLYLDIISARENNVGEVDTVEGFHSDGVHGSTIHKCEANVHVNVLVHLDRARQERVDFSLQ